MISVPRPVFNASSLAIAFPANHSEVQANWERTIIGRMRDFWFNLHSYLIKVTFLIKPSDTS